MVAYQVEASQLIVIDSEMFKFLNHVQDVIGYELLLKKQVLLIDKKCIRIYQIVENGFIEIKKYEFKTE